MLRAMHRVFAALPVVMLLAVSPSAMALGFGAVHNATRLGQAADFSIVVRLDEGETLEPECVAAEVSTGEQKLLASDVYTRLLKGASDREMRISVVTATRMREPVMTVRVFAGCPPRVERRFVSLLDPAPLRPRVEAAPEAVVAPVSAAAASTSTVVAASSQASDSLTALGPPATGCPRCASGGTAEGTSVRAPVAG